MTRSAKKRGLGASITAGAPERYGLDDTGAYLPRAKRLLLSNVYPDPEQVRQLAGVTLTALKQTPEDADRELADELETIRHLAETIKNDGLINPVSVQPADDGSGRYKILAGERRYWAHRLLGKQEIEARVYNTPPSNLVRFQFHENVQRRALSVAEYVGAVERMLEAEDDATRQSVVAGKTPLARYLQCSERHATRVLQVLRNQHLREALAQSPDASWSRVEAASSAKSSSEANALLIAAESASASPVPAKKPQRKSARGRNATQLKVQTKDRGKAVALLNGVGVSVSEDASWDDLNAALKQWLQA